MVLLASFDWEFVAAGWVLAAAGMLLAVWALFWDRPRGRRRCPKCWYDMAGVPGLRCPECGREARRERRLFRTRRRWRWAGAGVVLALAGISAAGGTAVLDRGWPALVPTTVLLAALPMLDVESGFPQGSVMMPKEPMRARLFRDLWEARALEGQLSRWQYDWLIHRCSRGDSRRRPGQDAWIYGYGTMLAFLHWQVETSRASARAPGSPLFRQRPPLPLTNQQIARIRTELAITGIRTRERWPIGAEVWVELRPRMNWWQFDAEPMLITAQLQGAEPIQVGSRGSADGWPDQLRALRWSDGLMYMGIATEAGHGISFDVSTYVDARGVDERPAVFTRTITLPATIIGTAEDIVQAVDAPEVTAALAAEFTPRLHRWVYDQEPAYVMLLPGNGRLSNAALARIMAEYPGFTLGLRVELLRRGTVVARGQAWWSLGDQPLGHSFVPVGNIVELAPLQPFHDDVGAFDEWTVRITGDPGVALRYPDARHYWKGELEAPLQWAAPGQR